MDATQHNPARWWNMTHRETGGRHTLARRYVLASRLLLTLVVMGVTGCHDTSAPTPQFTLDVWPFPRALQVGDMVTVRAVALDAAGGAHWDLSGVSIRLADTTAARLRADTLVAYRSGTAHLALEGTLEGRRLVGSRQVLITAAPLR